MFAFSVHLVVRGNENLTRERRKNTVGRLFQCMIEQVGKKL